MTKEEVCVECKNTNGEHKPGCSRGPKRERDSPTEFAKSFLPQFFKNGRYPALKKFVEGNNA